MTEPDQPIVPGSPPQGDPAICPHVSALSAHEQDRSAGLTKLAEGALLLVDAAKAFELGMHTVGCILVGRATQATAEGARLLGAVAEAEPYVCADCRRGQREGWHCCSACGCDRILSREAAALLDAAQRCEVGL